MGRSIVPSRMLSRRSVRDEQRLLVLIEVKILILDFALSNALILPLYLLMKGMDFSSSSH